MSLKQERIYEYLKKYEGVKFPTDHLAKIFETNVKTMRYVMSRMYKNKEWFKGFDREKEVMESQQGNDYVRHVFFVK